MKKKVLLVVSFLLSGLVIFFIGLSANRWRAHPTTKLIALTFDDGPNPPFTEALLQILGRTHTPATFFLIGRHIERFPATVEKLISEGHEIANHSYNHPRFTFLSSLGLTEEIRKTDALIRRFKPQGEIHFRAPYGGWPLPLSYWLLWQGRKNILFDITPSPPDYTRPNPNKILTSVLTRVRPGSIVGLHDGEGTTVETLVAVERLVPYLREQGYQFVTLSDLFSKENPT